MRKERKKVQGKGGIPILRRLVSLTLCLAMLASMAPSLPWSSVETAQALTSDKTTQTVTKTINWSVKGYAPDLYEITMEIDGETAKKTGVFNSGTKYSDNVKIGDYEFPISHQGYTETIDMYGQIVYAAIVKVEIVGETIMPAQTADTKADAIKKMNSQIFSNQLTTSVTTYHDPSTVGTVIRGYADAGKTNWNGGNWWTMRKGYEYTGDSGYNYYYDNYNASFDTNRGGTTTARIYYDSPDGRKAAPVTYDFGAKRSKITFSPGTGGTLTGVSTDYFVQADTYGNDSSGSKVPAVTPNYDKVFTGWSSDGGNTVLTQAELSERTVGTQDVTWVAQYRDATYDLLYVYNLPEGEQESSLLDKPSSPQTVVYTEDATVANPRLPGYKLTGWKISGSGTATDGKTIEGGTQTKDGTHDDWFTYDKTYTLTAQWEPRQFTINFDNGGINGASGTMEPQTVTYKSNATLKRNEFKATHNSFAYWQMNLENGGTLNLKDEAAAGRLIVPTEDGQSITLTAQWDAIHYYKTELDPSSGEIQSLSGYWTKSGERAVYRTDPSHKDQNNDAVDLDDYNFAIYPATAPVAARVGYEFKGWYSEYGGKGVKIYNADGSVAVSGEARRMVHDRVLYAYWTSEEMIIDNIPDQTYDSSAKEPELTVKVGSTTLNENQYTTVWENNVNVGIATVHVYGQGAYVGINQQKTFNIVKADQVLTFIPYGDTLTTIYGSDITNPANAKYDADKTTISYSLVSAKNAAGEDAAADTIAAIDEQSGVLTPKKAGKVVVRATSTETANAKAGSSDYTLNIQRAAPVLRFSNSSIAVKTGTEVSNILYIGAKYDADVAELTALTNYSVKTQNPTGVIAVGSLSGSGTDKAKLTSGTQLGDAVIRVDIPQTDKYSASSAEFALHVNDQTDIKYTASGYSGIYDGNPHIITVNATNPAPDYAPSQATVYYSDENLSLTDSGWSTTQPEIINTADSKEVYFKIEAPGFNAVKGSARVEIKPAPLISASLMSTSIPYTGADICPEIGAITAENNTTPQKLEAGAAADASGYKISYRNNIELTSDKNKAYAVVTGQGNYSGTLLLPFDITTNLWVNLDVNDGSGMAPTRVDGATGQRIVYETPSRAGYLFAGWSTDKGPGAAGNLNPIFTEDLNEKTLYAVWKKQSDKPMYTVIFEIQEDTEAFDTVNGPDYTYLTTNEDGKLGTQVLPVVKRIGENAQFYTFSGWFTPDGRRVGAATVFTEDTTVHAGWTYRNPDQKDPPYTVTFEPNGGMLTGETTVMTDEMGKLTKSSFPEATRAGYSFEGWYTQPTGGMSINEGNTFFTDTTLYAHWSYKGKPSEDGTYTITLDPAGGKLPQGISATMKTDENGRLAELPLVTREGYILSGWYTKAEGGVKVTGGDGGTVFTADTTIYAHWEEDSGYHQIIFDANGGKVEGQDRITRTTTGGAVESWPTDPQRTGYLFDGWYTQAQGGAKVEKESRFSGDSTVYARWKPDPEKFSGYTIRFDANGGTLSGAQTMQTDKEGKLSNLPQEPSYKGRTFIGWFTEKDGGIKVEAQKTVFFDDTTVYAMWSQDDNPVYSITFDAQGGSFADASTLQTRQTEAEAQTVIDWPKDPQKDGYTFMGWYTEPNQQGAKAASKDRFGGDTTLYAGWQEKSKAYTISFNANGGNLIGSASAQTDLKGMLTASSFAKAERDNYTFIGWFTAASGGMKVDAQTVFYEDTDLYAHWQYEGQNNGKPGDPGFSAVVSFDAGTGASVEPAILTTGEDGTLGDALDSLTAAKEGSRLLGWFTHKEGGVKIEKDTVFAADATVYGRWIKEGDSPAFIYNITFDANGGEPMKQTLRTDINKGKLTAAPQEPEKAGWTFDGWYTSTVNGQKADILNSVFGGDTTLYAVWKDENGQTQEEKQPPYTVTFDENTGAGAATTRIQTDDTGKLTELAPEPARAGYSFEGWYTEKNVEDGGYAVKAGTVFAEDTTLYARWNQIQFSITVDPNGGTLADGTVTPVSTDDSGKLPQLPEEPSYEGHTFKGWYTAANGGVLVTADTVFTSDGTIYAYWKSDMPTDPKPGEKGFSATISFDSNSGGRIENPAPVTTDESGIIGEGKLPALTWEGSQFLGWYTAADGGYPVEADTVFAGDTTVYAHWQRTRFNITLDANGGEFADGTQLTLTTEEDGTLAAIDALPVKDGFTLIGWSTAKEGGVFAEAGKTVFTSDACLYAVWEKTPTGQEKQFLILFNGNGGEPALQQAQTDGASGTLGDALAGITAPQRDGYTFAGWYTATTKGILIGRDTVFAADTMVYAGWKNEDGEDPADGKAPFTVQFNANGGMLINDAGEQVQIMSVQTDAQGHLKSLPVPTIENELLQFEGWYTEISGGYMINSENIFNQNMMLYARWYVPKKVTFDPNGGTFIDAGGYTTEDGKIIIGVNSQQKLSQMIPQIQRRGYHFAGWVKTDDNTAIDQNSLFEADTNVKALWEVDPDGEKKFEITFDANGGKLSGKAKLLTDTDGTLSGQSLPTASRSGHRFDGWYYNGSAVTTSTVFASDSVVYAKWTGTASGGGGGSSSGDSTVIEIIKPAPEEEDDPRIVKIKLLRYQLVARSKVTKSPSGKDSIRISWYDKKNRTLDFDGVEIFRSTLRNEGFTKKPIFVTNKEFYYNTAAKKGVKYYYKVRGYKTINGVKYYTKWSLKAWRKLDA